MKIKISPIRAAFLDKARNQGFDDQNQAVEVLTAEGGEPCRDVLRAAKKGEKLILASYCPFDKAGPYKEFGPVFILAHHSDESVDLTQLPLAQKQGYLGDNFVIKVYCDDQRITLAKLTTPECVIADLECFFGNSKTCFVVLRYAAYGCYSLRIERQ